MPTPGCKISLESRQPLVGSATFSPDFPAFAGHFPAAAGGPMLPGFLHIQLAIEVLQLAGLAAATGELPEIRHAKFLAPILPAIPIRIHIIPDSETPWFAATLSTAPDQIISRFQLRLIPRQI